VYFTLLVLTCSRVERTIWLMCSERFSSKWRPQSLIEIAFPLSFRVANHRQYTLNVNLVIPTAVPRAKRRAYVALCWSITFYGSEICCLREERLCHFHHRCAQTMYRITIAHAIRLICHLPAFLNASPLSPSTLSTIVDFFDGLATSPGCHSPEPHDKSWLAWSTILDLADVHKCIGAELQKIHWSSPDKHLGWAPIRHCTLISKKFTRKFQMNKWNV
jgi:hypothetical protein